MNGFFKVPEVDNEPVREYAPGSADAIALKAALVEARAVEIDIPMYINGEEVRTGNTHAMYPPHDIKHKLGVYHQGDASHVSKAIDSALGAKEKWENLAWEQRAAIFLKAADLVAGPYRMKLNAATMLAQSKNAYQAEIDASCELIYFLI